jgi:preprotein translocase subunit SecG
MKNILPILQLATAIILIVLILLQQRGTALGSAFGGEGSSFYSTRRGIQKKIYWGTIVLGILFIVFAMLNLLA